MISTATLINIAKQYLRSSKTSRAIPKHFAEHAATMAEESNAVPDLLFHTVLTVIDFHADTSGSTRAVYILGTHATLKSAKDFSLTSLEGLSYAPDDFEEYQARTTIPADEWTHGDGVMVYAHAPAGQEFFVSIDTTPNNEELPADANGKLVLPKGFNHLHYVLQTKTDYNQDKSGAYQSAEIEGCFVRRADALAAARSVLGGRQEYSQLDERDDVNEKGQWPFGDDVVVHAVAETGENYSVSVRTVPGAHKKFSKRA
ncbi:hypothetical protein B0T25DRAFT_546520 [Lasiosphaeria hispida]|uniref:Uncharacterized protein n=1 Tax=Lasiosphaeria hispida TaxID=260671 RepID=A0AAJ0MC41_9PEZI|nr:hypothetical protein B0T25DRAFT_546520 [Lasiosphaeria hispida]